MGFGEVVGGIISRLSSSQPVRILPIEEPLDEDVGENNNPPCGVVNGNNNAETGLKRQSDFLHTSEEQEGERGE